MSFLALAKIRQKLIEIHYPFVKREKRTINEIFEDVKTGFLKL